jgi:polysaccharide export outer membrane protein
MRLKFMCCAALMIMAVGTARPSAAQDAQRPAGDVTGSIFGSGGDFDPNQPIKSGFQLSINTTSAAGPEPDLTGAFQVDSTGNVLFKLIGPVNLKGLTPAQAADKLAATMKPYLKDPKVTASILSVPKPVIFLSGAVTRPGALAVNDDTRLSELLTLLGFTENSDLSHVRVTKRNAKGERTVSEYNFYKWLKPDPGRAPDESVNPPLADRDLVFVPYKVLPGVGSFSIEGDVVRPGVISMRLSVPTKLREALSLAGGITPTADRRRITLRRVGMEKTSTFEMDKIEADDPAHNIELKADDIVYVEKLSPNNFINFTGGFARPGKLPYTQPLTLMQAISEAGGVLPYAKGGRGRIIRPSMDGDPTKTALIAFDYGRIRDNKEPDKLLLPGDIVDIQQGQPRQNFDPFQVMQALFTLTLILDRLQGRRF